MKQLVNNQIYLTNGHPALFEENAAYQPVPIIGEVGFELFHQGRFGLFGGYVSLLNRYGGKTRAVLHNRKPFANELVSDPRLKRSR